MTLVTASAIYQMLTICGAGLSVPHPPCNPGSGGSTMIPISQARTLKLKKMKYLAQGP